MENNDILTSVKVDSNLFDEFKILCIRYKFSFYKLVKAAMYLYITDDKFREQITMTVLRNNFKINKNEI
jgi:hypothetical protein